MDVAQLVVTSLLAMVGLHLAHSYRRQQRLRIAERRLDAYSNLWALTEVARPTRVKKANVDSQGPLTREEARELYKKMTRWYFGSGGLLLPDATKRLYLEVKWRLGEYAVSAEPPKPYGERCMEEVGLLRQQMRLDLDIYSDPYLKIPGQEDEELLKKVDIEPAGWGTPWRTRVAERMRQEVQRRTAQLPPRPPKFTDEAS